MRILLQLTAIASLAAASVAYAAPGHLLSPSDTSLPPFSMSDLGGGLKGLSVDLAEAISKQIGEKITLDGVQWNAAIPGLSSGKYDLLMPPVNVTPERAAMM